MEDIRPQSGWPHAMLPSGDEGCLLSRRSEPELLASSCRSGGVQELCWDPHESASLGEGVGGVGPWRAATSGSGAVRSSGQWALGALAPRELAGADTLRGALLTPGGARGTGCGQRRTWPAARLTQGGLEQAVSTFWALFPFSLNGNSILVFVRHRVLFS